MSGGSSDLVELFTDGACSGNPGPGGWGCVLRWRGNERELSGAELQTTNNRMELTAAIRGLEALKRPSSVRLTTDSQYLVKGVTEWLPGWVRRGWKTSSGGGVLNRDLWERIGELSRIHRIQWVWVRGHAGHPENERCDRLAREAIARLVAGG